MSGLPMWTRRIRVGIGLSVLGLALPACHTGFGPTPGTFAPAEGPEGVRTVLRLEQGDPLKGEVLEVRDSALLILADGQPRVRLVPLERIRLGEFYQVRERIARGRFSGSEAREVIRRLSRFPAGLSRERMTELLEAHGQREPERVQ